MKSKNYFSKGIEISNALMNDIMFVCETRVKKIYFTRIGNNKVALAKMDANAIINKKNKDKNLKYDYRSIVKNN